MPSAVLSVAGLLPVEFLSVITLWHYALNNTFLVVWENELDGILADQTTPGPAARLSVRLSEWRRRGGRNTDSIHCRIPMPPSPPLPTHRTVTTIIDDDMVMMRMVQVTETIAPRGPLAGRT